MHIYIYDISKGNPACRWALNIALKTESVAKLLVSS